ncbi:MAG: hypothetical protein ACRED4_01455 [Brevundimonas sp.]
MTLTQNRLLDLTKSDSWFRYWMPYAFVKLEHPKLKHVWLPLNRNYKPLGYTSSVWVEYDDYIDQAISFARDPRLLKAVWSEEIEATDTQIWLYKSTMYREDYFARLERLMGVKQQIVAKAKS